MLSTYDAYQSYARDRAASVARVAKQATVQRDTAYYQANIGKVKDVDAFIGNARLYTYAMTSFGLEGAIPNRAFMRKVFTSDLGDPKSFANALSDGRYRRMAAAHAFAADGKVVSTAAAQDAAQQDETLGLYGRQSFVGTEKTSDVAYYKSHIGGVTSVRGLQADKRLYRIALEAYGIDPTTASDGAIARLLEGDRSDPSSVVDRSGPASIGPISSAGMEAIVAGHAASTGPDAASQADATIETAYFRRALPDVRSVDAFLADDRLVAYATAAFDLDPDGDGAARAYASARGPVPGATLTTAQRSDLLRAVLTSDLSQAGNAAATLGGNYAGFAAAFDFGPARLQSPADTAATVARYGARDGVRDGAQSGADAAETSYYEAKLPTLQTVDQLVGDPRLLAYVTGAYGLTFADGTGLQARSSLVQAALTGDPTDPAGSAAKAGPAFVALASDFATARVIGAQSGEAAESTVDLYGQAAGSTDDAAVETRHFIDAMAGVKGVDALLADSRLLAYVVKAYGVTVQPGTSDAETRARLRAVLVSDPADANGAAALGDDATRRLAAAFRFDASGVASRDPRPPAPATARPQSASALRATMDLYAERAGGDALARVKAGIETDHYRSAMAAVRSVDALLTDPRLVAYATKAYGVSVPGDLSEADAAALLRGILTSDAGDPKSVASLDGDGARALAAAFTFGSRYSGDDAITVDGRPDLVALASAFNFDGTGRVADPHIAQSQRATAAALASFAAAAPAAGIGAAEAKADADYYAASIGKVRTLRGFLADPRLVAVATVSCGVSRPAGLSDAAWTARLSAALTSDLADPKSPASALGGGYAKLAASYDFARGGTVAKVAAQRVQTAAAAALSAEPHAEQLMEDQAGRADAAVGLALYFGREAPKITNAYQILADRKLYDVATVSLGLPTSFSKLDVDAQARIIGDKLHLKDFGDPKKLDLFLRRFAILTDIDRAKAKMPSTPFDAKANDAAVDANAVLGTLNPPTSSTGEASILQLFQAPS